MTLPDLVVIPGGEHAGDCWDSAKNHVTPFEACHDVTVDNPKRSTQTLVPLGRTHG